MRILILMERFLFPLNHGGRIRSYNTFLRLAKRHQIDVLSYYDDTIDRPYLEPMRATCDRLELVPWREIRRFSPRFYANLLLSYFLPLPYSVFKCTSRSYRQALRRLVVERGYDLIVCDFPFMGANLDGIAEPPVLLFEHNVEYHVWQRHAQHTSSLWRRLYFGREWRKMYRFEKRLWERCAGIIAVSELDGQRIREDGSASVTVVPTGVDMDYIEPIPRAEEVGALIFLGSMDAMVNEDAVAWCVNEILPSVRARVPEAHLYIVGRDPTPRVRALQSAARGVTVTGTVDDVRPHLAKAQVFLVPMRIGGGTRIKIYEGMAAGKAVVSTSLGAEGLPLTPGRDVLLADTASQFAGDVVRVLTDRRLRKALGASARRLVCERFAWSTTVDVFENACVQAANTSRASSRDEPRCSRQALRRARYEQLR